MKTMAKVWGVWVACWLALIVIGCQAPQQRTAVNTLASVQTVTVAAYDAYLAAVVSGKVPTNDVPKVSRKFDVFQASFLVALDGVQYNTNAIAPQNLTTLSTDLLNLINQLNK